MKMIFPWSRYWCKRSGSMALNDYGFLSVPSSSTSSYYKSDVSSFGELNSKSCLILLGEPSSGKTIAIKKEYEKLKESNICYWFDLSEFGSEERVIQEIFVPVSNYSTNKGNLNIFIDHFEDLLLRIPSSGVLFKNWIQSLIPNNCLKLRLISRTGKWPEFITNVLYESFGADSVGIVEIAPLSKADVEVAINNTRIDRETFLNSLIQHKIQGFASNPKTLNYLIERFLSTGSFGNKTELFYQCLKVLSIENNNQKNSYLNKQNLSAERRLVIASRIATIFNFCNYKSISISQDFYNLPNTCLHYSQALEGKEYTGKYEFDFSEADVLETITSTALFSSRGPDRFGFTFQEYSEFLAAYYINIHRVALQQIKPLIFIPNDIEAKIIPQLRNVMGWLNSSIPEYVKEVIKTDPKSVLSGETDSLEKQYLSDLVDSLLGQFQCAEIHDLNFNERAHYQKLLHPKLAGQLRPYIIGKKNHYLARRAAIDIAEACELNELSGTLMSIVLDKKEELYIRSQASFALKKLNNEPEILELKKLLEGNLEFDKEDEVKGNILSTLWPKHISTDSMFSFISKPKVENLLGAYGGFLMRIHNNLIDEDLPSALKWAAKNFHEDRNGFDRLYDLIEDILCISWNHLENTTVRNAFAKIAVKRLNHYKHVKPSSSYKLNNSTLLHPSDSTRKSLIKAIINNLSSYHRYLFVSLSENKLLSEDDFNWIYEQAFKIKEPNKQCIWFDVLEDLFNMNNKEQIEQIYRGLNKNVHIKEKFGKYFAPIDYKSKEAKKIKESFLQRKKWYEDDLERKRKVKNTTTPSVTERVDSCINRYINKTEKNAWFDLCMQLTLQADSQYYGDEFNSDIMSLPGWKLCSDSQRESIIEIAEDYIKKYNSESNKWFDNRNINYRPARAGYKALILVAKKSINFFNNLDVSDFERWIDIIIAYPETIGVPDHDKTYIKLITKAFELIPEKASTALLKKLKLENQRGNGIFVLGKVEQINNETLNQDLIDEAKHKYITPNSLKDIITYLYKTKSSHLVDSYVKAELLKRNTNDRSKSFAKVALAYSDSEGWKLVYDLINENTEWGKELFLEAINYLEFNGQHSLVERFGNTNVAELYIWLSKNFPRKEDPKIEGAHMVSERESLTHLRNGLISIIKESGKPDAIKAIEKIHEELPEHDFIQLVLVDTKENIRSASWTPVESFELLEMFSKKNSRLIVSEEHLIDAVIESLVRLENKLQGETPNSIFLWNTTTEKTSRPKTENQLSDFIKSHLVEDLRENGIIALREVEISSKQGASGITGERTDIYVSGFVPNMNKSIQIVIEVKGSWHSELKTAMKTQLLDRYMENKDYSYGIYLVGWFPCLLWDTEDSRAKKVFNNKIEDAIDFFSQQAKDLSTTEKKIKACVLNCSLR